MFRHNLTIKNIGKSSLTNKIRRYGVPNVNSERTPLEIAQDKERKDAYKRNSKNILSFVKGAFQKFFPQFREYTLNVTSKNVKEENYYAVLRNVELSKTKGKAVSYVVNGSISLNEAGSTSFQVSRHIVGINKEQWDSF